MGFSDWLNWKVLPLFFALLFVVPSVFAINTDYMDGTYDTSDISEVGSVLNKFYSYALYLGYGLAVLFGTINLIMMIASTDMQGKLKARTNLMWMVIGIVLLGSFQVIISALI